MTEDVLDHEALSRADLRVATWLRAHATPLGDSIGLVLSNVGTPLWMGVLAAAVALGLAARRYWITLTGWIAAFAGAALLTWVLKIIIHRPRPEGASRFLHTASFSFPSGHALISLVGFGMLAYLLVTHWAPARRHRWLTISLVGTLVLAIGLSRLYLVVHYLSDVVAGYAAGLVWLATCLTGIDIALGRAERGAELGAELPPCLRRRAGGATLR